MARRAALICLLARQTAAEGGRGHAVASSTWQSTQHLPLSTARSVGKLVAGRVVPAPAPTPRPTTTTRAKGMTYFQRLAADAEAARQARLERLKAEAKAAEEAGALGLKKGEAD